MPRLMTNLVTFAAGLAALCALLVAEAGTRPFAGVRTAFELIDRKADAARLIRWSADDSCWRPGDA